MWNNAFQNELLTLMSLAQIIVHSHREATDGLKESCLSIKAMTRDIHAPDVGESVQIGQQTNVFTVALSDELIASVKMSRVSSKNR
jgi:cleavage and polyadenylation specificity factor subunit 2